MPVDIAASGKPPILDVRGLRKFFPIRKGLLRKVVGQVRAVDDVSFTIAEGETLGLVGESGCGKTTAARCILRALDPSAGQILFRTAAGEVVDVATLPERDMRPLRREMQMIFQDPYASLNPRMNLLDIVGEPLLVIDRMTSRAQRTERVAALLRLVGLRPEYMHRFPHAFSGGQRQRIVIARALALNPRLVVADEAVSALDVSVQAQVLNLMLRLQRELQLTYLFVAHDLGVVKHICDRVVVMYVGKVVEKGADRAALPRAQTPLHRRPPISGPGRRSPPALRHDGFAGRGAEPGRSAVWLLLPSPLPPRHRALCPKGAAPGRGRARPLRQLPPGAGAGAGRHRRAGWRACGRWSPPPGKGRRRRGR
jgi:ABC-type oligopeptide transport system ATPase subunit